MNAKSAYPQMIKKSREVFRQAVVGFQEYETESETKRKKGYKDVVGAEFLLIQRAL